MRASVFSSAAVVYSSTLKLVNWLVFSFQVKNKQEKTTLGGCFNVYNPKSVSKNAHFQSDNAHLLH